MYKYTLKLSFDESTSHGQLVKRIPNGSRILEFGCSDGQLAEYVKNNKGCSVFGIDLSEDAVAAAMPHLIGGFAADIETDDWMDKLPSEPFDVILFSDVLEHLKSPDEVLKKALIYLKDGGRILFSVPNIAHGDIILKLLAQRFDYTSHGLLDDTHVHFFSKENLSDFCKSAGLFLADTAASYCPVKSSEQAFEDKDSILESIVGAENYTSVYQYICLAYKEDFAKHEEIEAIDSVRKCNEKIVVYYDFGEGFSAVNSQTFLSADRTVDLTVKLPFGVKQIRLDLRECGGYIANSTEFFFDEEKTYPFLNVNIQKFENAYIFTKNDPQQIFKVPEGAEEFKARANIEPFFRQSLISNLFNKYSENELSLITTKHELSIKSAELEAVKTELDVKKMELDAMKPTIDVMSNNINSISDKFDTLNSTLDSKLTLLNTMSERVDTLSIELQAKKEKIEELLSEIDEKNSSLEVKQKELTLSAEENTELKGLLTENNVEKQLIKKELDKISAELDHYKTHYFAAINQRTELRARVAELEGMYSCISRSACWKMTKPIRVILDIIKWPLRKIKLFRLIRKGIRCYRENGFKYTWRKFKEKLHRKKNTEIARRPLYTEKELEAQRKEIFSKDIKFSILVPLYNTPEKFLCEMIESVIAQTYSNWELCLADGSDNKHRDVMHIVKKYAKHDKRIKYKKLEKNLGISGNTNACIDMATGDYISLFDHDDLLHPAALHDVMVEICEKGADFIYTDENTFSKTPADAYCPHFKPDYAPDTLRTNNYICHFTSFKASLIDEVGKFRPECDGSQDYDMVLRLTEKAKTIVHIPKILYYWRAHAASVATDISAKPYVITAAHKALEDHLFRVGLSGTVEDTVVPSMYKINYKIEQEELVSIIIANKDHTDDLDICLRSIKDKTTYKNYEIIVVENNSTEPKTWEYYEEARSKYGIKLVEWEAMNSEFNYSAINNFGVEQSSGKYVILLNNDTEIISPRWIEEMLMFSQRTDIGAVGAKLYYPDDTIQHAGIGIGLLTLAGHYHKNFPKGHPGYMGRLIYAHNVSAVTAACIMIPRKVWNEVGGLDETFKVAFNDVDLCMRIRKAGYLIVFTPFAELYHYESKSRGLDSAPEKRERFVGEVTRFQKRWRKELDDGDPYYNPNFSLDKEDFTIRG